IDAYLRHQIGRGELRPCDLIESHRESRNFVARDCHTRCCAMSPVSEQLFARAPEGAMKIELRYRSTRSFALITRECDQHRRSPKLLDQSRGDDADHTRMPVVIRQHDRERLVQIHPHDSLPRLLECDTTDLLPPAFRFRE